MRVSEHWPTTTLECWSTELRRHPSVSVPSHNNTNNGIMIPNSTIYDLEDDALKSITGLELTSTNYDVLIEILKERYGKVQLIIENHYRKLTDTSTASNKPAL